jgi:hypothetical protein
MHEYLASKLPGLLQQLRDYGVEVALELRDYGVEVAAAPRAKS